MQSNYEIAELFNLIPEDYERARMHDILYPYAWHKTDPRAPYWIPPRFDEDLGAILDLIPDLDSFYLWKTEEGWRARVGLAKQHYYLSNYEETKHEALLSAVVLATKGE